MTDVTPLFPFFESARPARSVIPHLDECTFTAPPVGTPTGPALPQFATLEEIIDYLKTFPLAQITGAHISNFNGHQDVYISVIKRLNLAMPNSFLPFTVAGQNLEKNALAAVKSFFTKTSPGWSLSSLKNGPEVLYLHNVYSSVPIIESGRIAATLDQLWVLSNKHCRILIAVEIDGDYKWDEGHDGSSNLTHSQKTVARSNLILTKGIGIYHIASTRCKNSDDAIAEVKKLWTNVCAAEFMRRMAITGNRIFSEKDLVPIFDFAAAKYISDKNDRLTPFTGIGAGDSRGHF